jgi:hypothetical protein
VRKLQLEKQAFEDRQKLQDSLMRNSMSFKTPALPKINSHISTSKPIKPIIDTFDYKSDYPGYVKLNFSKSDESRKDPIPYYENNDFTKSDPYLGINDDVDIGDETERYNQLQKERLKTIGKIERSIRENDRDEMHYTIGN